MHAVRVSPGGWGYNGNPDAPTFTPSILVTGGHYIAGWDGKSCWCTHNAERPTEPAAFKCKRCHSYVTDGMIRFLDDCSHTLKNQTVPLPDLPFVHTDAYLIAANGDHEENA